MTVARTSSPLRRLLSLLLLAAALPGITACNTVGSRAVHQAGIEYNQAMNAAYDEQVLLNLVRLRYRDTPFFLEPTELITSHVLGATAEAGATLGGGSADIDLGVGASYEENPTVIYTPLRGEAFLERLLTPVQVETLYLLMRSGWSIERVLRCCVRQLNGVLNAPSADGPTPDYTPEYRDFRRLAEELRRLQKGRLLMLDSEVKEVVAVVTPAVAPPSAAAPETGLHHEAGDAAGSRSGDTAAEDAPVIEQPQAPLVILLKQETAGEPKKPEESRRFYVLLSPEGVRHLEGWGGPQRDAVLTTAERRDDGSARVQLVPEQRSGSPGTMALHTRSLMGVLYFLSQAVEVPQEHVDAGLVTATAVDGGEQAAIRDDDPDQLNAPRGECAERRPWACPAGQPCLDWTETVLEDLFRVRVARKKPTGAYVAVPYRGHWFYVADCDLQSKSTYLLLKQLFSLQAGNPKDRASVLNYSLGG